MKYSVNTTNKIFSPSNEILTQVRHYKVAHIKILLQEKQTSYLVQENSKLNASYFFVAPVSSSQETEVGLLQEVAREIGDYTGILECVAKVSACVILAPLFYMATR